MIKFKLIKENYYKIKSKITSKYFYSLLTISTFTFLNIAVIIIVLFNPSVAFCAGPENIDLIIAKAGLDTNPEITRRVLIELLNRNLTPTQIQGITDILNNPIETTNNASNYRIHQGQLYNVGNVPNTSSINHNTIANLILGIAGIYLIYRSWEFLGSLFRHTAEIYVEDPETQIQLAQRIIRVSTYHPDVIQEIYHILRKY